MGTKNIRETTPIIPFEVWGRSPLSIAKYYGSVRIGGKVYHVVNDKGVALAELSNPNSKHYMNGEMAIQPGHPADLVREDWIPLYKKAGRARIFEFVKKGLKLSEAKRLANEERKKPISPELF